MSAFHRGAVRFGRRLTLAGSAALLAACTSTSAPPPSASAGSSGDPAPTATVQRTAHGVAHISAPDLETLAYGIAYAYAQDNICLAAEHLVTVRGERSRFFGASTPAQFGLRWVPNEQIDFFVTGHMDDARLARAWEGVSREAAALARGYVAGYNRFLTDHAGKLPAACNNQPWVRPMTPADLRRVSELSAVQASSGALAEGIVAAKPPVATQSSARSVQLADAVQALRELALVDPPWGSNAWAFGRDTTANGRGLLLGNPHFPWTGVNRFWQMHLTVPGQFDVMGASLAFSPIVSIGFNRDVAWSHTVSTGVRFTLHELQLVDGDPTSYIVDGAPEKMTARTVTIQVREADGKLASKTLTQWSTRYGPVVVVPRAGLAWTTKTAYALQDANRGNVRGYDAWLAFARARSVDDLQRAQRGLGVPWVNTIAADRAGNAFYADASVVPDVDAEQLKRCAPSKPAAALLVAARIAVLDGSRSDCNWRRDAASPVPGLTPIERMPIVMRSDWVHNSNDSFVYTHPGVTFNGISPLVGDDLVRRPRTRSGLIEIPQLLAQGKVTPEAVQRQLFANRNLTARLVLDDLQRACAQGAPTAEARDGCAALATWDRNNNLDSRGAHLFREFWRSAMAIPNVWRVPFKRDDAVGTPTGLNMTDATVAAKVWDTLGQAVTKVRSAGFALDAPLGDVQRAATSSTPLGVHGGDEIEGVLNNVGDRRTPGIGKNGLQIDYGTSYVQTVTFDDRGPVAYAILTYGQSTNPDSPYATDQTRLFAAKTWPRLPFHADEIARERVGEVLMLRR